MDLLGNQVVAFWIDEAGRSYSTDPASTEPDFSNLAQDYFVPWFIEESGFSIERVATNLFLPVNIAFVPQPGPGPLDPLFYVTELYGKVKVVTRDHTVATFAEGLLNYDPDGVFPGSGEMGLTGICVEPASGDVFVAGTYESQGAMYNRVMRLYANASGLAADSLGVVLSGIPSSPSHQVQQVSIGPDGRLFVQTGDGMVPDTVSARNPNDERGKVLRVNLDGTIPPDNPYGPTNKVWAVGFRNPFGGTWRGRQLFVTDNGFNSEDRVARVVPGGDYGWCCDITRYALDLFEHGGITAIATAPRSFAGPQYNLDLFVGFSGWTYAPGIVPVGKFIRRLHLNPAGIVVSDSSFVRYVGAGYGTVVGVAFGPDGLYFTDLYGEAGFGEDGLTRANIYRVSAGPGLLTPVDEPEDAGPIALDAYAYPNPTRSDATLHFDLARGQRVSVRVYDVSGRLVTTLEDGWMPAGLQLIRWDGRDVGGHLAASGVHLIRVSTEDGATRTARVTLLR